MPKTYSRTYKSVFFFVAIIIGACILAPLAFRDRMYVPFAGLTVSGIITLICIFPIATEKLIITDNSIIKSHKFPTKSYEIKFDEIAMIIDDDISTWPIDGHIIHLIPKKEANKKFKYFTIHGGYKNRKDLLTEIISRVGPDTYIEDEVYQYLGKGHSKTVTK